MARWKTSWVVRMGVRLLESGQRIGAEPEPQGFQPDDAGRRDVPQVHVRPQPGDEVRLQRGGRGLEQQAVLAEAGREHVLDQPNRSAPSGRQIPDRPLSLASSVTSDAPAARSSAMYSAQIRG